MAGPASPKAAGRGLSGLVICEIADYAARGMRSRGTPAEITSGGSDGTVGGSEDDSLVVWMVRVTSVQLCLNLAKAWSISGSAASFSIVMTGLTHYNFAKPA